MAIPALLSTGLKIFQATRSKGSKGSSNVTTKTSVVSGNNIFKGGTIVKSKGVGGTSNFINKFLPQASDAPLKDTKFKDKRYKPLEDILNSITKLLSSILSTFKAQDKLSRQQADDQLQKVNKDAKAARESKLEGKNKFSPLQTISNKLSKSGSWLDKIIMFVASIALGSLVLTLYRSFTNIIQFFKDAYETIKNFFEKLGEYISPLWDVFKFISKIASPLSKITPKKDLEYAKKIEKEDASINKDLDQGGVSDGESFADLEAKILEEDKDNLNASEFTEEQLKIIDDAGGMGNIAPSMMTPIVDRSFAKSMIKEHEGLSLTKYLDTEGNPTIGYGHLITADDPDLMALPLGGKISKARADKLFNRDFNEHLNAAREIPGFYNASKKQQAALIDLTFNMGPNWYEGFPSFTKAFEAGDYKEAARQLEFADPNNRPGVKSNWANQVGPRRSAPILNLIQDKGVEDFPHLKEIKKLLSDHSRQLNNLSNKISSISMDVGEEEETIVVPIPQKTASKGGGFGGGVQFVPIGDGSGLNSKIIRTKLAAV